MSLLRDPMVALVKHTDSCTQRVPMTSKEPLSPRVECWKPATNKNEEINTIYVLSSTNYKCRLIPTDTMFSDHLALTSDVFTVPRQYSGKFRTLANPTSDSSGRDLQWGPSCYWVATREYSWQSSRKSRVLLCCFVYNKNGFHAFFVNWLHRVFKPYFVN